MGVGTTEIPLSLEMWPIWVMFVNEIVQRHFKSMYIQKNIIWFWELYKTSSTL